MITSLHVMKMGLAIAQARLSLSFSYQCKRDSTWFLWYRQVL